MSDAKTGDELFQTSLVIGLILITKILINPKSNHSPKKEIFVVQREFLAIA